MSAFLLILSMLHPYLTAFLEWSEAAGVPGMQMLGYFVMEFGSLGLELPYLYLALPVVYGTGRLLSALAALALTALMLVVILAYRFILFWLTFATV